jgi:predicted tellurium resistance membrane protein TerC
MNEGKMLELFTIENIGSLLVLIFLQAVLGFDNLLYISIESQRAPKESQKKVRFWGIIIAVLLRVVLLFIMIHLIEKLKKPFYIFEFQGWIEGGINFASVVFMFGGIFIIYTAVKEINHLLSNEHLDASNDQLNKKSALQVILLIVFINLIFSFDSILSAIAITNVLILLIIAILTSGIAMIVLADKVTEFLERNRMYEVLGLFILLIVGVVLLGESGTAASHAMHNESLQIKIFGYPLIPMSKSTFYFSIVVLFLVEFIQTRYQRRLNRDRKNK